MVHMVLVIKHVLDYMLLVSVTHILDIKQHFHSLELSNSSYRIYVITMKKFPISTGGVVHY